jgi:hypothetical protein
LQYCNRTEYNLCIVTFGSFFKTKDGLIQYVITALEITGFWVEGNFYYNKNSNIVSSNIAMPRRQKF